jgi:hypothetical protein
MSVVFDDPIDRQSPPNDPARITAVIASDRAYFGTSAFAIRLLRLDQKIGSRADEPPMRGEHPRHRRDAVSGIQRSVFEVRRSDASAVRGWHACQGAGVLGRVTFGEKIGALRPIAARAEGRTPSPQI